MVKILEYIWLDRDIELRSKIKIVKTDIQDIDKVPIWNYDGSSTNQAEKNKSEIILKPRYMCNNPFYDGYIIMCDTYIPGDNNGTLIPHPTNKRSCCSTKLMTIKEKEIWFGIEQEYYIFELKTTNPYGYDPENLYRLKNNKFYCGTKTDQLKGFDLAKEHMGHCIKAGLDIAGINQESGPSQWEYQIGPVEGITVADQLWVSRFILLRLAANKGVSISFHPKPLGDEYPGSGCHINVSTSDMRNDGGYSNIESAIKKLGETHTQFKEACIKNFDTRLSGDHNTAMKDQFSYGISSRDKSIRIPRDTAVRKCGYYEDRRPSANIDPYEVLHFYI